MNIAQKFLLSFLAELKTQGHQPTQRMANYALNQIPEVHQCTSFREGDFIVWRCPVCENYERRFNLRTGHMKCVGKEGNFIHTGTSDGQQNMEALTLNTHPN